MNFIAILVAALIPTVVGFIWYNPKIFGTVWMRASGMTEEKMKGANMAVIFGVSLLLSVMLSLVLTQIVIHQVHMFSLVVTQPGFEDATSEWAKYYADFQDKFGDSFRTFSHGAFHGGVFGGLFLALPILGTNALFERKSFKYIAINAGYWIVTLALMGGVLGVWQ